jgi:ribonuclease BN (tRNA processing enzyme)
MRVTLLGTAGWMPSRRRETTCFASRADDALFIFDAGTGLRRLGDVEHAPLLDGVRDIHLFLTHYHLDHVCGLAYLPGVLPGRQITIHAPAASLTGIDPETVLSGLLRRPYNPHDWEDLTHLRVAPISAQSVVAGRTVSVRPQRHSDVSVAYRVDDAFVVATDTVTDPGTADFSAGVGLLLHEAWYCAADVAAGPPPGSAAHSEAGAVGRLATDAAVGRLVLIHLDPRRTESSYAALVAAARTTFGTAELLADGAVVDTEKRGVLADGIVTIPGET